MYKISLNNLEFYSLHGYYQEENLIGNVFIVDMFVEIPDHVLETENLASTANYEVLFVIAKEEMQNTQKLLETVVKNIHDRIKRLNPNIQHIEVSLRKKHIPIDGMIGSASVSYSTKI
jgi:dihydroneopterin aldolase